MAYSDKVVDHFNNPRNMGSFKKDEEGVGTGMVGAPECGDVMKLQIKVQNDTIVDAKFKTFGCGSAIASSSLATEWLKGKTLEEAQKNQEYRHRAGVEPPAGENPLLGVGRRCHQSRVGRLSEEG
jgi:NifU-like protein involved in Fe-S cluster formation